jgi:hypothetical protein
MLSASTGSPRSSAAAKMSLAQAHQTSSEEFFTRLGQRPPSAYLTRRSLLDNPDVEQFLFDDLYLDRDLIRTVEERMHTCERE